MAEYEVPDGIIQAVSRDKVAKCIAIGTLIFSTVIFLSISWKSGLAVLAAYVIGFLFCILFRERISRLGLLKHTPEPHTSTVTPKLHQCSVCGNQLCSRHRPVALLFQETYLPEKVDHALQQLLEKILEQYIERWHSRVCEDPGFELELRRSMQSAVSSVLHRADQMDESRLMTERLLPAAISHLDTLLRSKAADVPETSQERWHTASEVQGELHSPDQEEVPELWSLGQEPHKSLPINWHPATLSRRHELAYLRHFSLRLLPSILPSQQLTCRAWRGLVHEVLARWVLLPAMDLLADSSVVLRLLARLLDHTPLAPSSNPTPRTVPTLRRFVSAQGTQSLSRLRVALSSVLREPQLLYHFMQFLKKMGTVHVLQFCLDLEKFNDRILEPELDGEQLRELYQEAWDLFSLYFLPSSPDCVAFPTEVVRAMRAVLEGGEKNVLCLRNTPPLFQAFEYAYARLERDLLPLFHHSEDYFLMLCGGRLSKSKKKRSQRQRVEEGPGWARGSGSAAFAEIQGDDWCSAGDFEPEVQAHRNLSAWRVCVPRVYLRPDMPGSSRISAIMVIIVQRIDIHEEDDPADCCWTVYRSHADFCALTSKLQEFHGEFNQVGGVPLKRPLTRGLEALEAWRGEGEDYLRALLHTPALQNSDLLCAFLSPDIDFADVIGGAELSLGRVLRTVRLRKENGQHLEPFVANLVAATRRHPRTRKPREEQEQSPSPAPQRKLNLEHVVFGDNLGQGGVPCIAVAPVEAPHSTRKPLQGMFDCITYFVVRMLGASRVVMQVALMLRSLVRGTVDAFYQRRLQTKLYHALGPNRIIWLINMLKDEISGQRGSNRVSPEVEARTGSLVLHRLENLLPWPVSRLPQTKPTLAALLAALRTPLLNKQLAYTLLDILAEELFPELSSAAEEDSNRS